MAVLLAGAGRRPWPGLAEALDLVRHGVAARWRGSAGAAADWRAGVGVAGLAALTLLAAFGALQLLAVAPGSVAYPGDDLTIPLAAASAVAAVLGLLYWAAGARRTALAATLCTDATLVAASFTARGLALGPFWTLLAGLVALGVIAAAALADDRAFSAARGIVRPWVVLAVTAALTLLARESNWRYAGWHYVVYGGAGNPALHLIPHAFSLAFALAAVAAIGAALLRRAATPLVAVAVLSPVLLANAASDVVRRVLAGNATVTVDLHDLALRLACVTILALAALLATRHGHRPATPA